MEGSLDALSYVQTSRKSKLYWKAGGLFGALRLLSGGPFSGSFWEGVVVTIAGGGVAPSPGWPRKGPPPLQVSLASVFAIIP